MRDKTIVETYRDVTIEQMIVTVEEAMSQALNYWGDLPPSMKQVVEQFRGSTGGGN
jgi:Ribonuclease G/E